MSNVKHWVIADTHFNHKRILELEERPYDTFEEMNEDYIKKWNEVVRQHDKVYHLGDFAIHCNKEQTKKLVDRLNGFIILRKGNHDVKSTKWYYDVGFFEVYSHSIVYDFIDGVPIVFSHKPIDFKSSKTSLYNVHGHIHGRNYGDDKHINVSIEQYGRPVEINKLIKEMINNK